VEHRHRHIKDYFVRDPRGIMNDNRSTGALGRPEWPPFGPPELQWLWNDDLIGGWGQSRLEVEPSAPRLADRFLTVLVPSDAGEAARPRIDQGNSTDRRAAAAVIREGSRMDVVVFGADAAGGALTETAIDVPAAPLNGDLVVTTLVPGAAYYIRAKTAGGVQRIAISQASGGVVADAAGMIRVRLDAIPRARLGEPIPGAPGVAAAAASAGAEPGQDTAGAAEAGQTPAAAGTRRHSGLLMVDARDEPARRAWSDRIDDMIASGELRVREIVDDPQTPGRRREHLAQMHQGLPVFGGALTRLWEGTEAAAVYGTLYRTVTVDVVPQLTVEDAAARLSRAFGIPPAQARAPELLILPADGTYRLAYRFRIVTREDAVVYFLDANTGARLLQFSDLGRTVM
jgi:hypothetical protein